MFCKYIHWDWALENRSTTSPELSKKAVWLVNEPWRFPCLHVPSTGRNNKHVHHAQLFDMNLRVGHQINIPVLIQATILLTELSHRPHSWILEPLLTAANSQIREHVYFDLPSNFIVLCHGHGCYIEFAYVISVSYWPCCCDEIDAESTLKKEVLILAHG